MNDSRLRQVFQQKFQQKKSAFVASIAAISAALAVTAMVAGCGGAISATIGGTVSGLSGGTTVHLLDNGTDALTVSANGSFTFATEVTAGDAYSVTVATQPVGETCTVSNGSGTVSQNSGDVTSVSIACVANTTSSNYVLASVSGLASGKTVVLSDGTDTSYTASSNTTFLFPTALSAGTTYSVTVVTQPSGQTCTVTNGSGTIPSSGTVTTALVTCQ
jgi:hypothetical protein